MLNAVKISKEEEKELYLFSIEQLENDLLRGRITDASFHENMENLKHQFKD